MRSGQCLGCKRLTLLFPDYCGRCEDRFATKIKAHIDICEVCSSVGWTNDILVETELVSMCRSCWGDMLNEVGD